MISGLTIKPLIHFRFIFVYGVRKFSLFLKLKFIYFNWRLITLQYCIGFAIHQHKSATGVHVFSVLRPLPPPSPYHPSGLSQCTSPKHPVSCIEPGLAILSYTILNMFQYHSPNHPTLSLSHRVQKTILYICVSFSVLHTGLSFSSVQFSRSVMSDSLRPNESQHARPPCPSPTPGVHPDSRPSSQ